MLQNKPLMGTASQTSAGASPVCLDPLSTPIEPLQSEHPPLYGQREPRRLMKDTMSLITLAFPNTSVHKHFQAALSF